MLISYNWLKELVDIDLDAAALGERLTLIGLEIDGVHESVDDVVYDIEVTSNRGDCLSHVGVAREIAAFLETSVKFPESPDDIPTQTDLVEVLDPESCPRFTARIIRGVTVGPSPDWLVKWLTSVGERSINNIADITNFVMHELGQPMHSFDLDKLSGKRIVVRRARAGEKIKTLDEIERTLDESMLAVCDADKPIAVAGVMGGFDSGITVESTNVLLEVANFDRDRIRQTSRDLNLGTEASHRFERGVDIENVIRASNRATDLICKLAGGKADEFSDVYSGPLETAAVSAPDIASEIGRLTGITVSADETDEILARLGIQKNAKSEYVPPTWRHDIAIPEDLVEEVARIKGYETIAEEIPASRGAGEYHVREPRKRKLRGVLAALGFDEAISYSFVDSGAPQRYTTVSQLNSEESTPVTINDPIIEGADLMRPTLLHGLIESVRTNLNHKNSNLRLFEIGRVFKGAHKPTDLPVESETLSIVISGHEEFENTAAYGREFTYFDLKSVVEEAADAVGVPGLAFSASDDISHLQSGQSALISFGDTVVGSAGKLSNSIAAGYKFKQPVFIAEIDLEPLLEAEEAVSSYQPLPLYPSVVRDVSLVVPRETEYSDIVSVLGSHQFEYFQTAEYVDTYTGSGIKDNEKSVTIRIEYRSNAGTLTDDDVDNVHASVLSEFENRLDARFR